MFDRLAGYKTYAVAAALGALAVLKALGKIDEATYQALLGVLGAGGFAAMRAAINRIAK